MDWSNLTVSDLVGLGQLAGMLFAAGVIYAGHRHLASAFREHVREDREQFHAIAERDRVHGERIAHLEGAKKP